MTGAVMGRASYMAPEQAEGNIEQIGPLADICEKIAQGTLVTKP